VIVTQAPDVLWLRDTDKDGRCDRVEKLYTGLGIRDTHAVINNPRMGWDGWVYATHGYSGSQHVLSGDGQRDFGVIGSGVVRFRPDGSAFEQYSSKGGNTWGLTVTGDNPFVAEVLEFTSALVAGRPPAPDLLEAELALAAVLALYESARAGQPVRLAEFLAPATAG